MISGNNGYIVNMNSKILVRNNRSQWISILIVLAGLVAFAFFSVLGLVLILSAFLAFGIYSALRKLGFFKSPPSHDPNSDGDTIVLESEDYEVVEKGKE